MKKKSLKQLKNKLWKLISMRVRSSSGVCYTCDKPLPFTDRSACHFWSKGGHGAVRYHEDNLRVGCNSCNLFKSGNLAEYAVRLRKEIGNERFDALAMLAHTTHKFSHDELLALIQFHEEQIVTEQG